MPKELGVPKYIKYTEAEVDQQLVKMGKFMGTTEGKYGAQYNFLELESNDHVVLNKCGTLEWRVREGYMQEGEVFDIYFEGKEVIEKGTFAGKEANKLKIEKYEPKELAELGFEGEGKVEVAVDPQVAVQAGNNAVSGSERIAADSLE